MRTERFSWENGWKELLTCSSPITVADMSLLRNKNLSAAASPPPSISGALLSFRDAARDAADITKSFQYLPYMTYNRDMLLPPHDLPGETYQLHRFDRHQHQQHKPLPK